MLVNRESSRQCTCMLICRSHMNCSTSKESVPGLFFSNLQCSRGGENPTSKCGINGDGLMIWPLKLSPTGNPVATLSPNNFNTVSIFAICFYKNRPFLPEFGGRVAFWRFFAKKTNKSLQRIFHVCKHMLLLE